MRDFDVIPVMVNWHFCLINIGLHIQFKISLLLVFLAKLPPRVSQTAHWLDMTTILKENGYVHFSFIILSQTIFGTLNEVGSLVLIKLLQLYHKMLF